MKRLLTALMATLALSVTQPAYAQVYTQQEINYLQAMEQQNYLEITPGTPQMTLPHAHMFCELRREGGSESFVWNYFMYSMEATRLSHDITDENFDYVIDSLSVAYYFAQRELCPDVR